MYTTSDALIEALCEAGVSYIFANLGSDHPGVIEALAQRRAKNLPTPRVITCPNEMVALSAAHGHAMLSGVAQAVLVHVECGTQALAGAVHNADKGRIPALIIAGCSPYTQHGELRGSRNEFIHWIQDVHDQRGIVRGYMRYDAEIRTGRNVKEVVGRALQFAHADPQGPVYLMVAREVLEETIPERQSVARTWPSLAPAAIPESSAAEIATALASAERPLVVTSYLGRNPSAVEELIRLCRKLAIGVLESVPSRMNFPHSDPLYLGSQWNGTEQNAALAEADVVLVLDSDVPWIPTVNRPAERAVIFHIDVDPLKQQMPLWSFAPHASFRADACTALQQLNAALTRVAVDARRVASRFEHYASVHKVRMGEVAAGGRARDRLTAEHFVSRLRRHLRDDAIVINEGITNYQAVFDQLAMNRPGSIFTSGGGSLGWNGGAAVGAKLARPDSEVVAISGDGSYMFSVPSSVHWMARKYQTPFLQIVLNNGGWKAPKLSTLAIHPSGHASRADDLGISFDPPPDYAGIAAAAGGAFARAVEKIDEIDGALEAALQAVRVQRRCAVLDVHLEES